MQTTIFDMYRSRIAVRMTLHGSKHNVDNSSTRTKRYNVQTVIATAEWCVTGRGHQEAHCMHVNNVTDLDRFNWTDYDKVVVTMTQHAPTAMANGIALMATATV